MTMQTIPGGLTLPRPPAGVSDTPTVSSSTIPGATQSLSLICLAPKAGTIRKVHWRAVISAAGDLEARLESVSAAGIPSGTLLHASATKTETLSASGWQTWDFGGGNGAAVTAGDKLAVVLKAAAGPPSGFLSVLIDSANPTGSTATGGLPYLYNSTSAAKLQYAPLMALEYSDGTTAPIPGVWPASDFTTMNWDNAATLSRGMRFSLPFPYRLAGVWAWFRGEAGGSYTLELFEADGTPFASPVTVTIDGDHQYSATQMAIITWLWPTPQTLAKNTVYRAAIRPGGTQDAYLAYLDADTNDLLDAVDGGKAFYYTETDADPPTGTGDWTDTDTRRPLMGLVIDGLDDGTAVPEPAVLSPRRRIYTPPPQVRRRSTTIGITPPPPSVPIPVRGRTKHHVRHSVRRRTQPTAFTQTIINQTAIIAYSRKVR